MGSNPTSCTNILIIESIALLEQLIIESIALLEQLIIESIAQLVEHIPFKDGVLSSNLSGFTKKNLGISVVHKNLDLEG